MGQEAIGWTGPGKSWKGAGWSVFYKEPTALLNAPQDVLFFQSWGASDDGTSWQAARAPKESVFRPNCKDPSCESSRSSSVADLDGFWFECMTCGKLFLDQDFRLTMASSKAETKEIEGRYEAYKKKQDQIKALERLINFQQLRRRRLEERSALARAVPRVLKKGAAREKVIFNLPTRPSGTAVECERIVWNLPTPPKPPPKPPIYASLLRFCERFAEGQRLEADRRSSEAYWEWARKNLPKADAEILSDLCPKRRETPRVKIVSDIHVKCDLCDHTFWTYGHLGVAPKRNVCPCCSK